MKLLWVMYHPGYARNNEPTLRALAERGHEIVLGFNRKRRDPTDLLADKLAAEYPQISTRDLPERTDRWQLTAAFFRRCMDYLRYYDPAYDDAGALRTRIEERIPGFVTQLFGRLDLHGHPGRRKRVHETLAAIESAIPTDPGIDRVLKEIKPDAVIVTPLVDFDSKQTDWLKSAQQAGIPTCLAVFSWDNLTNKGHVRLVPDLVTVWNPAQANEAEQFHGIPRERVRVTGAQCYDRWFDRKPAMSRDEFLTLTGLDPQEPYVLYLCSSPFIAGTKEPLLVHDLIAAMRGSSDPLLNKAGVMVRPHPQNAGVWRDWNDKEFERVVVFPREGANPVDKKRQDDFFDSLYHSAAVVGINTSAMIEAGIVGRPVITLRDPRFAATQEGTLHFRHLVRCKLVHVTDSLDDCVRLIASALDGKLRDEARANEFLTAFIRPQGLRAASTPLCVAALESLPKIRPAARTSRTVRDAAIRTLLYPIEFAGLRRAQGRDAKGGARPKSSPVKKPKSKPAQAEEPEGAGKSEAKGAGASGQQAGRKLVRLAGGAVRALGVETFVKRNVLPHLIFAASGGRGEEAGYQKLIEDQVREELDDLAAGSEPIVVGPWTSEVGFELLYWIPFLRWVSETYRLDPARLTVVSRGGVAPWYHGLASRYVDIFDHMSVEEFRQSKENQWQQEGLQKQTLLDPFDERVLNDCLDRHGLPAGTKVLHPSLMYRLFALFFTERAGFDVVARHTAAADRWARPKPPSSLQLPDSYYAVKFYRRPSLPANETNIVALQGIIAALARLRPVVVLTSSKHYDDHAVFPSQALPNVMPIAAEPPTENLAIQSSVIAGADAFFCTYGGLAYLGPKYGVSTYGLYSEPEHLKWQHLQAALAAPDCRADLVVLRPSALSRLLDGARLEDVAAPRPTRIPPGRMAGPS